jgi:exodeoxyribonuclease III
MKIATFNINNVNKRLANLLDWLAAAKPDVVCLQELKAADAEFPLGAIEKAGYGAVWRGQRTWNGVALLARGTTPIVTRTELPGDPGDGQSRYIEAAVNGVLVTSLYAPNGNPQPGPKFDYKLAWLERLAAHAAELLATGVPVVLAGDFNVVPTDRDIYPTKSWAKDALVQPASRAAFRRILAQGWIDAIRTLHPDALMYTYWDYKRNRWERDGGLRIDHLLLSGAVSKRLRAAGVDREIRGEDGASDHAPAWIVLRDHAEAGAQTTARKAAGRAPRGAAASKPTKPPRGQRAAASKPTKPPRGQPSAPRRPLLVIDGDSFAHRAYHALPKTIVRADGKGAGALVGFANMLLRLYQAEQPRAVLVGWDTLDAPTYRHQKFPAYQSGRQFDAALLDQLAVLPSFVAACGFAWVKAPGYEADDFLAAAVAAEERRGGTALVASGDRDSYQLASAATTILFPVRAGEMARIGPAEVRERYEVDPKQVPDFIALRGDPSDKLPGARGVGPKGAASLVRQYGTLEAMLAAGRFAEQAEMLRLYRAIATMDATAPLPPLADQTPTWTTASALAEEWGLGQLAKRLAELGRAS